jgi:hypothetical protein
VTDAPRAGRRSADRIEPETGPTPRRVVVVGTTGSGKTTFARDLARSLGVPCVELDALFWRPRWTKAPPQEFRASVDAATSGPGWVADGNYGPVRDLVWGRADTLVWLDYRLPLILWRLVRRTARRLARDEAMWAGNRETLERAVDPGVSIVFWSLRSHGKHRRRYPALLRRHPGLRVVRLRSPRQTEAWRSTVAPLA